ncbi:hypothetical protein [Actinokineospora sp. NPDC004072]
MTEHRTVAEAFAPLTKAAFDFVPLTAEKAHELTLTDGPLRYWVLLDLRAAHVHVVVYRDTQRADLPDLAAAEGLIAANKVPTSARTLYDLTHAITTQATLARTLHPTLLGPHGPALFTRAGQDWDGLR